MTIYNAFWVFIWSDRILHNFLMNIMQRAGSRPAAQIVPNSSLGVALGNVTKLLENPEDPEDPSDYS